MRNPETGASPIVPGAVDAAHALTPAVEADLDYALTLDAFKRVCTNLTAYGNTLSEQHRAALMELVGMFTLMALGRQRGRFAFPLPTGMGKTQSVIAWLAALVASGRADLSVAVAATKIEHLCEMRRALLANGVPEDRLGLLHSLRYDPAKVSDDGTAEDGYASWPSDGDAAADRQILLVTHQRVKGGCLDRFNTYRDGPRSLLIWDESLIASESEALDLTVIRAEVGHLSAFLGPDSEAIRFFRRVLLAVETESARQSAGGTPERVPIPVLTEDERGAIRESFRHRDGIGYASLAALVDHATEHFSFTHTGQGQGLLRYEILIPRELQSVAVLDASYPIRRLEQLDSSIKACGQHAVGIKTYEDVTIHHLRRATGRDALRRSAGLQRRDERVLNLDVCRMVSRLPHDEGVVVFTYKDRLPRQRQRGQKGVLDRLKEDMVEEGIDLDARVLDVHDGRSKPRFVFLTFGSETASSTFRYCKHVVFFGVLRRKQLDLAAAIRGQSDDPTRPIPRSELVECESSEMAHALYQGACRGACRMVTNGRANRMDVWVVMRDLRPLEIMAQAMPGVQIEEWDESPPKLGRTAALAATVRAFLLGLDSSVSSLSSVRLKKELALHGMADDTFRSVIEKAVAGTEWARSARSVVRSTPVPN